MIVFYFNCKYFALVTFILQKAMILFAARILPSLPLYLVYGSFINISSRP